LHLLGHVAQQAPLLVKLLLLLQGARCVVSRRM
jgi:hypothetical protein